MRNLSGNRGPDRDTNLVLAPYKTHALVLEIACSLGRPILIYYHSICLEQCFPTTVPHSVMGSEINRRTN